MTDTCTKNVGMIDMDGTVADFEKAIREKYNRLKSPGEPELVNLRSRVPHVKARLDMIKRAPNFWLDLDPIESNFQILKLATDIGFKLHVLTQAPKGNANAWAEKYNWCAKHLKDYLGDPPENIHMTRDKGLVYAKFLFDDYTKYMEQWLEYRPRGLGIMPLTPENKDFRHPQVVHWDGTNLDEIAERLQKAYNRKAGKS